MGWQPLKSNFEFNVFYPHSKHAPQIIQGYFYQMQKYELSINQRKTQIKETANYTPFLIKVIIARICDSVNQKSYKQICILFLKKFVVKLRYALQHVTIPLHSKRTYSIFSRLPHPKRNSAKNLIFPIKTSRSRPFAGLFGSPPPSADHPHPSLPAGKQLLRPSSPSRSSYRKIALKTVSLLQQFHLPPPGFQSEDRVTSTLTTTRSPLRHRRNWCGRTLERSRFTQQRRSIKRFFPLQPRFHGGDVGVVFCRGSPFQKFPSDLSISSILQIVQRKYTVIADSLNWFSVQIF